MGHRVKRINDLITAERVAIFFGLLSTCLIVALVIVIVHRDNLWSELEEAKRKLDVLEDYIQKKFLAGTASGFV
ncbi:uncharacterized protein Dana_GF27894 [Drosophila ananassae]|uniref:Uncharacterized protein n=1 Tax=Drosophila ananassae TaxID=7217 RepID=A0A0P8XWZ5_DROAN|nr:uncharacterized protein LOC26515303 [Drosophila ananassae]KPU79282.1 uncharacterized protein Dana_GF27894 [Drosophila ananassae]